MTNAILDRTTKDSAILTASDGRMWDVSGDNWAELKVDALYIASIENLTIELFNSELPEGGAA